MLPKIGADVGRYRIVGQLGSGGMGVVYAAVHRELQREVAIKLLAPNLVHDPSHRKRFLREARSLARLDSRHVVRVHDAGDEDGWLFIATELVKGGDLATRLRDGGPLEPVTAALVAADVADGLSEAHAAGVLHRDIKPSNVLLRDRPGGRLDPVLCDFGIAALSDIDSTATSGVIGTPAYMAPERHDGAEATVAADVYGVGCLLWATLTGRPPYEGSPLQVMMSHQSGPVPQLPTVALGADRLNDVLATAMAKRPEDRYPSAQALSRALRAAAGSTAVVGAVPTSPPDGHTVAAPTWVPTSGTRPPAPTAPDGPRPDPVTPPRRRRGPLVAAAAVVVLALAGTAVGTTLARDGGDAPADDSPATIADLTTVDETLADDGPAEPATDDVPDPGSSDGSVEDGPSDPAPTAGRRVVPGFRCWDGRTTARLAQCSEPTGTAGAAWLFGSRNVRGCVTGSSDGRVLEIECSVPTIGGGRACIRYSQWADHATALENYDNDRDMQSRTTWRGLQRWEGTWRNADCPMYKVALLYPTAPWSVTIYAESRVARTWLLEQQLSTRTPAELTGERVG